MAFPPLPGNDHHLPSLAAPDDAEGRWHPDARLGQEPVQVVDAREPLTVERVNDIARPETGDLGWTRRLDRDHENAGGGRTPVVLAGAQDLLPPHPDVAAPDTPVVDEPTGDDPRGVARDGEAETLRRQDHRRVH